MTIASRPTKTPHRWKIIAGLGVFWLGAWIAGLPLPNCDDGFFAGAAIHLAKTGQLANPWISGWMQWIPGVHLDRFYVHPPFAAFVLAGWIRMAGVSAASLTGYACLVGALGSGAAALLWLRLGAGRGAAVLAAIVVATYVLHRGLRPEPLAIALLLAGQVLMLDRGGRRFFGCAATLASGLCHAFFVTLVIPTLLLHIRNRSERGSVIRHLVLAAIVVAAALLWSIHGEVVWFAHDFVGHARMVTPSADRLSRFAAALTTGWTAVPNLIAIAAFTTLAVWQILRAPAARGLVCTSLMALGIMLLLGIGLYAPFAATIAIMAASGIALAWLPTLQGARRALALMPACAFSTWGVLEHALEFTANRGAPFVDHAAIEQYTRESAPAQVLFDYGTLRYVYDFKPPEKSSDLWWSWSLDLDSRWWSPAKIGDRDVWVISRHADEKSPIIFGHEFRSIHVSRDAAVYVGASMPAPPDSVRFRYTSRSDQR